METAPFSTRLKDAIASGSSAIVAKMIREAEEAARQSIETAATAKARAFDPTLDEAEIKTAREAALDAEFTSQRMGEAIALLTAKRDEFLRAEEGGTRLEAYEAARRRRDSAAARLKAEYPTLADQLGALLAEIVAADEVVEIANRSLPNGVSPLARVEAHARPGHRPYGVPPIAGMIIPAFNADAINPTWGPSRLALASPVPAFRPNLTSNAAEAVMTDATSPASRAGEPALGNRPGSPVRSIPRMGGEAA